MEFTINNAFNVIVDVELQEFNIWKNGKMLALESVWC